MQQLDAKKILQALRYAIKDIKSGNSTAAEAQTRFALKEIAGFNRDVEVTISIR